LFESAHWRRGSNIKIRLWGITKGRRKRGKWKKRKKDAGEEENTEEGII
jgi:hypothetical protein